jgi:hypothetical protein
VSSENQPTETATVAASLPRLDLSRSYLHSLFGQQQALGPAWGEEDPAFLIAEESQGIYRVSLYARPAADHYALQLVVSPPLRAADAVLSFGRRAYRAPFDDNGTATVPKVPASLLNGLYGPALKVRVRIEPRAL